MNNDETRINLDCDIDDVLIRSSDFIQGYVDSNTIFKSNILNAIEQLRRNCQYYVDCVTDECNKAFKEERMPVLKSFPNMGVNISEGTKIDLSKLTDDEKKRIFVLPIQKATYYLEIANLILNQFLEERDMFLELDNLEYGETKKYDFALERKEIEHFKEIIRNNYCAILAINRFCLNEGQRIITESKASGLDPKYGSLVKMDTNDIIRTNDNNNTREYLLFEKPLNDILSCVKYSVLDYALEYFDIRRAFSHEIVDYDSIYTVDHVDFDVVMAIRKLMRTGKINKLRFVTHHNGLREARAKERMVKTLFPEAEFIGMRFHSEEHHLKRRGRSSKFAGTAKNIVDFVPSRELLLDDSKDNCRDWHNNGGLVILYRRLTSAEKATGMEQMDYPRIVDFSELNDVIDEVLAKKKQKIKKLEEK